MARTVKWPIVPWPATWPRYNQTGQDDCDMLVGPCCCGAWHLWTEFEILDLSDRKVLYRYGKEVAVEHKEKAMETVDIVIPAQRHALAINDLIRELATHIDSKQWTEAGVVWGKIVASAQAIQELENPIRTIILQKSQEEGK